MVETRYRRILSGMHFESPHERAYMERRINGLIEALTGARKSKRKLK
jgi:hypothetical protein